MGYTTDFDGQINLSRALTADEKIFLKKFSETRRMQRDNAKLEVPALNQQLGLGLGAEGEFYVHGEGFMGQNAADLSIVNYNCHPSTQPSLWCQWVPSDCGGFIEWDGGEKFYCYVEWMEYIVEKFLAPWGIVANGEIKWFGESLDDIGKIVVSNNVVGVKNGSIIYD